LESDLKSRPLKNSFKLPKYAVKVRKTLSTEEEFSTQLEIGIF